MNKGKEKTKKSKRALAIQSPKGMHDILPQDQRLWQKVRDAVADVTECYGFRRIDTPIAEHSALFERATGETTEIVQKQMFSLLSRGDDKLVLRPEGTPSVVRAYIQHGLSHLGQPLKLYYEGPMFRYEQPQAGRFRQFHQAGFEILGGDEDALYDVQVMIAAFRVVEDVKIKNATVRVNSVGCKHCRPAYRKKLQDYYKDKKMCGDCKRRLQTNPLRLLDCKEPECIALKKDAPVILDYLCTACTKTFKSVLEYLEEVGLPYIPDHYLVRGLDYYTGPVFEILAEGFDFALGGGGRYNDLVEMMGGKKTSAVGASLGIDRLVEVLKTTDTREPHKTKAKAFLIHVGEVAKRKSLAIIEQLRKENIRVLESLGKDSLKGQLRNADKAGVPFALIFGQKEAFEENIIIRDLATGAQETVPLRKLAENIKRKLK